MYSNAICSPSSPRSERAIKASDRSQSSEPRKPSDTAGLRVLVVEDEAVIAALLAEVLEDMGHDVCGIEATELGAVAAASRCRPDLMIVDARLGDGSGLQAVAEILRSGFVPHIFVSGDAARVQGLRPESVVLQKPFREVELARAMSRVMGSTAPH